MDIDIDFQDRNKALKHLKFVQGSILKDGELTPHNTACYFQNIPVDPVTDLAVFPYNSREQERFFKIDFINVRSVYADIEDEAHINRLLSEEPTWEMLLDWDIVKGLFQIGSTRTFDIIKKNPPQNIHHLAMLIALIRPPMSHLIGKSWDFIEKNIWNITEEQKKAGAFRKSHAYSYAFALKVHMNKLREQALKSEEDENSH